MLHGRFEVLNCKFSFHEYRSTELWLLGVRTTHCLSMVEQIYALPALWAHDEQHMLHPQLHDACKLEGWLPSISPSLAFLSYFFSSIFSLLLVLCSIFLCPTPLSSVVSFDWVFAFGAAHGTLLTHGNEKLDKFIRRKISAWVNQNKHSVWIQLAHQCITTTSTSIASTTCVPPKHWLARHPLAIISIETGTWAMVEGCLQSQLATCKNPWSCSTWQLTIRIQKGKSQSESLRWRSCWNCI